MEILSLGHSCFRLKGREITIITDPVDPTSGFNPGKMTADVVTISHPSPNHSCRKWITGTPKILDGPGEYEIKETVITGIATYHDRVKGQERGKNTVFTFQMDDLLLCHLGDIGHLLTEEESLQVGNVDVVFIPVGGRVTINASMAAELVSQLEPSIVIPMHYRTAAAKIELDPVDKFCHEMGLKEFTSQPRLVVNRNTLPSETQVAVLQYKK